MQRRSTWKGWREFIGKGRERRGGSNEYTNVEDGIDYNLENDWAENLNKCT